MILLDNKADDAKATLSQLLLGTKKSGGNAFGKMLQELTGKEQEPLREELAMLLDLKEGGTKGKSLGKSLTELLHGDKEAKLSPEEKAEAQLLHPRLARTLPANELRTLINNAREHLKTQIMEAADVKEMPKTLKGLIELAQKVGVDLEKITYEQIPGQKAVAILQEKAADIKTSAPEPMTEQLMQSKQEKKPKEAENQKHEPLRDLLRADAKAMDAAAANASKLPAQTERPVEASGEKTKEPLFASALSTLLRGSEEEKTEKTDTEPLSHKGAQPLAGAAAKAEPLQLKINEAKEMVRHFAADIREAVENYKPPFTRIKLQLNPGRLGEVDVTMVQRGNNVHINISSNPAAITTLAQNATELRTQLAQNGLGNATMHFGSGPEQQQHQQQQQHRQASALYEQLEKMEDFDFPEYLEITVPRYA